MSKKSRLLYFVMGLFTTLLLLPLLYALGVPSYADVLTAIFGDGSIIWATSFSLILLLLITIGMGKIIKR
ncbi:hypothetical protein AN964_02735 [Heyndrickxia shackletonii]|uniref:Uncharacterized protein n=1 Tax=Heyndrickxia shackletonii TaxID=157838 RepID=A0A0Q3TES6_9BACI|nr:hypothetical protein [Heyndrickxia shackletonii]KQL52558.1 hypothetical protein AN964_02735 [Heyndrickxia shackletonii]NEZ01140.1 hypothetical protein [Heyndrickxia shackletonii]